MGDGQESAGKGAEDAVLGYARAGSERGMEWVVRWVGWWLIAMGLESGSRLAMEVAGSLQIIRGITGPFSARLLLATAVYLILGYEVTRRSRLALVAVQIAIPIGAVVEALNQPRNGSYLMVFSGFVSAAFNWVIIRSIQKRADAAGALLPVKENELAAPGGGDVGLLARRIGWHYAGVWLSTMVAVAWIMGSPTSASSTNLWSSYLIRTSFFASFVLLAVMPAWVAALIAGKKWGALGLMVQVPLAAVAPFAGVIGVELWFGRSGLRVVQSGGIATIISLAGRSGFALLIWWMWKQWRREGEVVG